MDAVAAALRHARARRAATLGRLVTLLRFPTVSADPRHERDMDACAAWLAHLLGGIGLVDVRVSPGQAAPVVTAAWGSACRSVFGRGPALLPSGGSIPFVSTLAAARGIDIALFGFGLPTDRTHAPNERFYLPSLFRRTAACVHLYHRLASELCESDAPLFPATVA
jgi:acetylornithine deacetylase/succinyl-diaminopimelate desuccinylase-like protein